MSFDGPLSQISSFYPALSKSVEKNCDLWKKLVEFFIHMIGQNHAANNNNHKFEMFYTANPT